MGYTYCMHVPRDDLVVTFQKSFLFKSLDAQQINLLIAHSEILFFEPEKMIYLENSPADSIMIIFEGEIELLKERKYFVEQLNVLREEGIFGLDAFEAEMKRRSSARALTATIVIRIDKRIFEKLVDKRSGLHRKISLMRDADTMIRKAHLQTKTIAESVYYLTRKHPLGLFFKVTIMGISLLAINGAFFLLFREGALSKGFFNTIAFLSSAGFSLGVYWLINEWKNDLYIFTAKRVIVQNQNILLLDKRLETPLSKIINSGFQKSFLGRLFNYGDLTVRTYTGLSKLSRIPRVEMVQNYLEYMLDKYRQEYAEGMEHVPGGLFGQKAESIPSDVHPKEGRTFGNENVLVESGFNGIKKFKLFPQKEKADGFILYHMHWITLIQKVMMPSLLFVSETLLFFFLKINHNLFLDKPYAPIIFSLFALLNICWWLYGYFDWLNDTYLITRDEIIDTFRRPFGVEDRRIAPIKNIQSVRYERKGLLGLIFNFGTVYIRIGDDDFTFDDVARPAEVQQELFAAFEAAIERERVRKEKYQHQRVVDWMESYQRMRPADPQ